MEEVQERFNALDEIKQFIIKDALELNTTNTILNTTRAEMREHIMNAFDELELTDEQKESYGLKLAEYRCVCELDDFKPNNYVRWIRLDDPERKLNKGGIIASATIQKEDVYVLCRIYVTKTRHLFITVKGSEAIFFQNFNDTEKILLSAMEYLNK